MQIHDYDENYASFWSVFSRKDDALDLRNISWSSSVGSLASDGAFLICTQAPEKG